MTIEEFWIRNRHKILLITIIRYMVKGLIWAYRLFKRNRAFFLLSVISLCLPIACIVSIYAIVTFHHSFDKNLKDASNLFRVIGRLNTDDNYQLTATVPHPLASVLRSEIAMLEQVSNIYIHSGQIRIARQGKSDLKFKQSNIGFVQAEAFEILQFEWLFGRNRDDVNLIYISETCSIRLFGSTVTVGKEIIMSNDKALVVGGVYKDFPKTTDFPFQMVTDYRNQEGINPVYSEQDWSRLNGGTQCIVRLTKASSPAQVESVINTTFSKYNKIEGYELKLQPFSEIHTTKPGNYSGVIFDKTYSWISYAIASLLGLIGSINFINLTTARSITRCKEIGIKKILGASRKGLLLQLVTECLLITVVAIGIGFILASFMLSTFNTSLELIIPITLSDVQVIDWMAFGLLVLILMTIVSGLYPALLLSSVKPLDAIKLKLANVDKQMRFPIRKSLIGLQTGFSVLLVYCSLTVLNQLKFMESQNPGFVSENIIVFPIQDLPLADQRAFKSALERELSIEIVSSNSGPPIAKIRNVDLFYTAEMGEAQPANFVLKAVDEQYLQLFDISLVAGRNFTPQDNMGQVMINEFAARTFNFSSAEDAIGKELIWSYNHMVRKRIVGVVKNFSTSSLQQEMQAVLLFYEPTAFSEMSIRFKENPDMAILSRVESLWDRVNPDFLFEYELLDDLVSRQYLFIRIIGRSTVFFVVVALIITALGLYGLADYLGNSKNKEIGIRKVIGASTTSILISLLREILRPIGIASILFLTTSILLMNFWLDSFAYRIHSISFLTLCSLSLMLVVIILSVGYRMLRAAQANPVETLKHE